MTGTVLIIGTLDTKAKDLRYLQTKLEDEGARTLLMDVSCKSRPVDEFPGISCRTVAMAGGSEFQAVAGLDKISAVQVMIKGATKVTKGLCDERKIQGVRFACFRSLRQWTAFPQIHRRQIGTPWQN